MTHESKYKAGSPDTRGDLRRNTKRGSILVTTLICMMFVVVMGTAVLAHTLTGLRQSNRIRSDTVAFNLAESGVDRSLRWLKNQASPPSATYAFDPFGGTQTLTGGTYSIVVTPDPGNPGATLKKYTIVALGTAGPMTERIEMVARQTSFGKYAYFTDKETSAVSGGRIWFYSGDRIRGPAHSNNRNASDFQINWSSTATQPIFEDVVTSVADQMNYAPSTPNTETQFSKIYRAGSRGYELGVDEIPMPNSTDQQKIAAWGPNGSYPSTNGVYTPSGGGIYIRGDASVEMLVDGSGNQQYKIVQGSDTWTITVDLAGNKISSKKNSGSTVNTTGSGSGVLYCTGNITSLKGTIADNKLTGNPATVQHRSAYTIATDGTKDIKISDNIKHKTAYNPGLPPNHVDNLKAGTLGLVSGDVTVATGAPQNLEIDAVIMAGSSTTDGSFSVQDYNSKTPTGTLKVVGGIIQKARGAVGTINSSGGLSTGYAKDYVYDARMADNPPPYFPTTGGYDRISWRRLVN